MVAIILIICVIIICLVLLSEPTLGDIYVNKYGDLVKVVDVYNNWITVFKMAIDSDGRIKECSSYYSIDLLTFKLNYSKWPK